VHADPGCAWLRGELLDSAAALGPLPPLGASSNGSRRSGRRQRVASVGPVES
jgi:hypothetical protein